MRTSTLGLVSALVLGGCSGSDPFGESLLAGGADGGTTADASCADGVATCAGGSRSVCIGGVVVAEPCPTGKACDEDAPTCADVVCTPRQSRCADGATSETCNRAGTAWTKLACGSAQSCDPMTGLCDACICVPGTASGICADADHQSICAPNCLGFEPRACGDAKTCVQGACLDVVCTPDTKRCLDADSFEVCNATGTAWLTTDCAANHTCVEGVCLEILCTPGAKRCVTPESEETCNASGTAWAEGTTCGAEDACVADQGCTSLGAIASPIDMRIFGSADVRSYAAPAAMSLGTIDP